MVARLDALSLAIAAASVWASVGFVDGKMVYATTRKTIEFDWRLSREGGFIVGKPGSFN